MPAWILANVHRDAKSRPDPFGLEEVVAWLGYSQHYVKQKQLPPGPEPPTVEQLKERIGIVHVLHKTLYGENGQQMGEGA